MVLGHSYEEDNPYNKISCNSSCCHIIIAAIHLWYGLLGYHQRIPLTRYNCCNGILCRVISWITYRICICSFYVVRIYSFIQAINREIQYQVLKTITHQSQITVYVRNC